MSAPAVRWGIVGPGRIASALVGDFAHTPNAILLAVASRSAERAAAFAAAHGIERAYGSYAELIAADDLDAVYIATPHPQHLAIGRAALLAGKAVLVEKAFTATLAGTEALIDQAQTSGVFAMEAMWTRFQPAIVRTRRLIEDGLIGAVQSVQADLGVVRTFDRTDRVFAHELGGGAILDLGVYLVNFAQMILGEPISVTAKGSLEPSGVDAAASLLVEFGGGATATLMCSLHSPMPGHARVYGSEGWIDVLPRFHHPKSIVLHRQGEDPRPITDLPLGAGYAHELIEVTECLRAGQLESSVMPLSDTRSVQRVLTTALDQLGVHFEEDPSAMA
ncbi:MAG: oxidoreductase [Frankiales bacterium]|nr:oxidoreductase [Frankiales bacterium]